MPAGPALHFTGLYCIMLDTQLSGLVLSNATMQYHAGLWLASNAAIQLGLLKSGLSKP